MANQAKIGKGSMVLDPFCGTGSLLLSAAHFGSISFGADIDLQVLRGNKYFDHGNRLKGKQRKSVLVAESDIVEQTADHSIYANFEQYALPKPELSRCDLSNLCWRHFEGMFDAILCNPPYGLRAGARKSGTKKPIKIGKQYEDNYEMILDAHANKRNIL